MMKLNDVFQVELASGKDVVELQPDIGAIAKCPGGGILVSGTAPPESGFDYYCRTFFPKVGINEVMQHAQYKLFCVVKWLK